MIADLEKATKITLCCLAEQVRCRQQNIFACFGGHTLTRGSQLQCCS